MVCPSRELGIVGLFWGLALVGACVVLDQPDHRGSFRAQSTATDHVATPSSDPSPPRAAGRADEMMLELITPASVATRSSGGHAHARQADMMRLSVAFEPPSPRVGEQLTVSLTVENRSRRPIHGLRLFSSGPWSSFTILDVSPDGTFDRSWLGASFFAPGTIPPSQTSHVQIVALANESGHRQFTCTPTALPGQPLPYMADGRIVVEGAVWISP